MRLAKSTEQAVAILLFLATDNNQAYVPLDNIHRHIGGSRTYLQKIVRKLVVADLVHSVAGNSGGFSLGKPLGSITLFDVMSAIEGKLDTGAQFGSLAEMVKSSNDEEPYDGNLEIVSDFRNADKQYEKVLKRINLMSILNRAH